MTERVRRHPPDSAAAVERARTIAASVVDPELPMLTLADLGVLRDVSIADDATVVVTIAPTYTGCPATAAMRDDVRYRLQGAGFDRVEVRISLDPAWSTDWITAAGRRALAAAGISPPGPAPGRDEPVPLRLGPPTRTVRCPRCGAGTTELVSEFAATPCTALYRCSSCAEPFHHVKEL